MSMKNVKKKKQEWKIVDWAGNDKTSYYGTFKTFEDAWAALYEEFDHLEEDDFNEMMGEFYVELQYIG